MFDIAVIGRGAAGLASALLLAQRGNRVVIIGGPARSKTIEILPPATIHCIRRCTRDERPWRQMATNNLGTLSLWGDEVPRAVDYLSQAPGVGLQINRADFDSSLLAASTATGAFVLDGSRIAAVRREDHAWRLTVTGSSGRNLVRAKFLVIANGRSGSTFGLTRRRPADALVAISFRTLQRLSEPRTWIEADPSGWWYSVPAPANQRAAAFFTEAGLVPKRPALARWCCKKLADSKLIARRIHSLELESIRVSRASTCWLENAAGSDWAAVGDALASFDPISSAGLRFAFESGFELARLLGSGWRSQEYAAWTAIAWRAYARGVRAVYQREARWNDHHFWKARDIAADRLTKKTTPGAE